MRTQRQALESSLREAVRNDDITNSLAQRGNKDVERVFQDEIKKHEKTVEYIRQNIIAQANILSALTERNAEYVDAREQVQGLMRERDDKIGSLVASYHAYEDLLDKTTKGLEFYAKLEKNVNKLLSRVEGVIKVQVEERNQLLDSSAKKIAEARALSLSLVAGGAQTSGGYDYKSEFAPGAPPPDTPDQPLPPTTKTGRPKLIDYLNARKEASKEDKDIPAIRPQPVGSESEPPFVAHSAISQYGVSMGTMATGHPYQYNQQGQNTIPATSQPSPYFSYGQNYGVKTSHSETSSSSYVTPAQQSNFNTGGTTSNITSHYTVGSTQPQANSSNDIQNQNVGPRSNPLTERKTGEQVNVDGKNQQQPGVNQMQQQPGLYQQQHSGVYLQQQSGVHQGQKPGANQQQPRVPQQQQLVVQQPELHQQLQPGQQQQQPALYQQQHPGIHQQQQPGINLQQKPGVQQPGVYQQQSGIHHQQQQKPGVNQHKHYGFQLHQQSGVYQQQQPGEQQPGVYQQQQPGVYQQQQPGVQQQQQQSGVHQQQQQPGVQKQPTLNQHPLVVHQQQEKPGANQQQLGVNQHQQFPGVTKQQQLTGLNPQQGVHQQQQKLGVNQQQQHLPGVFQQPQPGFNQQRPVVTQQPGINQQQSEVYQQQQKAGVSLHQHYGFQQKQQTGVYQQQQPGEQQPGVYQQQQPGVLQQQQQHGVHPQQQASFYPPEANQQQMSGLYQQQLGVLQHQQQLWHQQQQATLKHQPRVSQPGAMTPHQMRPIFPGEQQHNISPAVVSNSPAQFSTIASSQTGSGQPMHYLHLKPANQTSHCPVSLSGVTVQSTSSVVNPPGQPFATAGYNSSQPPKHGSYHAGLATTVGQTQSTFVHQTSSAVMHPVVPQPGTQAHASVTAHPGPPASSNNADKQVNTNVLKESNDLASNLDLLAGLSLETTSSSCEFPVPSTLLTGESINFTSVSVSEPSGKNEKGPTSVKKQAFIFETEKLKSETEKLQMLVASLNQRTLQGTLPIDSLWREVVESVEKSSTKLSVSVGRCYPMKNRASDVLPFDQSRVELRERKVNIYYFPDLYDIKLCMFTILPGIFAMLDLMIFRGSEYNFVTIDVKFIQTPTFP